MFGRKKRDVVDAERLRRVVNLIPEYVDALIEERRTRTDAVNGLDARESHIKRLRGYRKPMKFSVVELERYLKEGAVA